MAGCKHAFGHGAERGYINALRRRSPPRGPHPQGRRPIITGPQIRELIDMALSSPAERGLPFSAWTVPQLAEYWRQRGLLAPITDEWVHRLLRREGLRTQRVRTWKTSHDSTFDRKRHASGSSTGRARRARR